MIRDTPCSNFLQQQREARVQTWPKPSYTVRAAVEKEVVVNGGSLGGTYPTSTYLIFGEDEKFHGNYNKDFAIDVHAICITISSSKFVSQIRRKAGASLTPSWIVSKNPYLKEQRVND
ncbi:uncharacterized protein ARMOST_20717 [Armillaria ostoyae]|uniref:Uncharacterized protein n=1 Tax=Armillaria ostoyae TaxID=47428 RepID=A0A284S856_ARMOS|nr:uncharacterized protein ARMOST_20717 [Armillaria ostoyae]